MKAAAPSGVVTFLFTDVEGSTRRWEADAEAMRVALLAHDEVLRSAIEAHEGFLFSHTGDGVVAAFSSPRSAVDAAINAQRALELPVRWVSRPEKPSCATGTISARCSTALRG
jgi:class 3 adenylate cyclase